MTDSTITTETVGAAPSNAAPRPQADDQPKVILVTGASSGTGEATARQFAREGHIVIATARRTDRLSALVEELSAEGCRATAQALDVTDHKQYLQVVNETVERFGRLDVLVANAGVMLLSRLDALLVDEWDRMLEVNVRGLYNGLAAALPHFDRQGLGHVVTVASIGAHQVVPTSAIYCATKYAA